MVKQRKICLSFSDTKIGCEEFGYIDRPKGRVDADDEDRLYERYVSGMTRGKVRVVNGYVWIG